MEYATGVEHKAVVNNDRGIAQLGDVIERLGQRLFASLLAHDDFHQPHAIDWREEMDADKLVRPFRFLRELRYRTGGRVGGEYCTFANERFRLAVGFGFDSGIFEHRFTEQVATDRKSP